MREYHHWLQKRTPTLLHWALTKPRPGSLFRDAKPRSSSARTTTTRSDDTQRALFLTRTPISPAQQYAKPEDVVRDLVSSFLFPEVDRGILRERGLRLPP